MTDKTRDKYAIQFELVYYSSDNRRTQEEDLICFQRVLKVIKFFEHFICVEMKGLPVFAVALQPVLTPKLINHFLSLRSGVNIKRIQGQCDDSLFANDYTVGNVKKSGNEINIQFKTGDIYQSNVVNFNHLT